MTDLEAASAAVHENTPDSWYVGRLDCDEWHGQWSMYAFDPSEQPMVGKRSRECAALGQTELHCVQTMACGPGGMEEGR